MVNGFLRVPDFIGIAAGLMGNKNNKAGFKKKYRKVVIFV